MPDHPGIRYFTSATSRLVYRCAALPRVERSPTRRQVPRPPIGRACDRIHPNLAAPRRNSRSATRGAFALAGRGRRMSHRRPLPLSLPARSIARGSQNSRHGAEKACPTVPSDEPAVSPAVGEVMRGRRSCAACASHRPCCPPHWWRSSRCRVLRVLDEAALTVSTLSTTGRLPITTPARFDLTSGSFLPSHPRRVREVAHRPRAQGRRRRTRTVP
jgi:hypothetical protein